MFDIPVLFIIFNRLSTTKQVFEQIRNAKPKYLFIAADGPRKNKKGEAEKCDEVRNFVLESIDWDCEVKTLFRTENLGCKTAVSGAIKWYFSQVDMGIVLEDDCLPSASFFGYCKTLLIAHKDDPSIGMISGHNYFGKTNVGKVDYSLITTCGVWGWASWKRVLKNYDENYSTLTDHKREEVKTICINKKTESNLIKNAFLAATNEINTWDYQFCEYLIVNGMYTIMPSINLIRNIGFISDSTHTGTAPYWYKDASYNYTKELRINHNKPDRDLSKRIELFHLPRKKGLKKTCKRFLKRHVQRIIKRLDQSKINRIRYIDGRIGERKRYEYYAKKLRSIGKNVKIDTGVFMYGMEYISINDNTHIDKNCIIIGAPSDLDLSQRIIKRHENDTDLIEKGEVYIGKDCHISQNTMIYGYEGVYIGNNCVMSAGAKIYSLTSMPSNPFNESQVISIVPYSGDSPTLLGKVVLGENVWLGIDTVVSPGVTIGKNSFVRSNSFVMKSFTENSYIAGDPAEFKRNRFKVEVLK